MNNARDSSWMHLFFAFFFFCNFTCGSRNEEISMRTARIVTLTDNNREKLCPSFPPEIRGIFDSWPQLHTFVRIFPFITQSYSRTTACEEDIGRSRDSWKMRCVQKRDIATMYMAGKKKTLKPPPRPDCCMRMSMILLTGLLCVQNIIHPVLQFFSYFILI